MQRNTEQIIAIINDVTLNQGYYIIYVTTQRLVGLQVNKKDEPANVTAALKSVFRRDIYGLIKKRKKSKNLQIPQNINLDKLLQINSKNFTISNDEISTIYFCKTWRTTCLHIEIKYNNPTLQKQLSNKKQDEKMSNTQFDQKQTIFLLHIDTKQIKASTSALKQVYGKKFTTNNI
ncbi:MAG: hypothetical protein LBC12_03185 [Nitrososphaerota archaeon]|jgi:hypothetical protein|nr:hypothetical protein [Nitrososphaerota archaeon]